MRSERCSSNSLRYFSLLSPCEELHLAPDLHSYRRSDAGEDITGAENQLVSITGTSNMANRAVDHCPASTAARLAVYLLLLLGLDNFAGESLRKCLDDMH